MPTRGNTRERNMLCVWVECKSHKSEAIRDCRALGWIVGWAMVVMLEIYNAMAASHVSRAPPRWLWLMICGWLERGLFVKATVRLTTSLGNFVAASRLLLYIPIWVEASPPFSQLHTSHLFPFSLSCFSLRTSSFPGPRAESNTVARSQPVSPWAHRPKARVSADPNCLGLA